MKWIFRFIIFKENCLVIKLSLLLILSLYKWYIWYWFRVHTGFCWFFLLWFWVFVYLVYISQGSFIDSNYLIHHKGIFSNLYTCTWKVKFIYWCLIIHNIIFIVLIIFYYYWTIFGYFYHWRDKKIYIDTVSWHIRSFGWEKKKTFSFITYKLTLT